MGGRRSKKPPSLRQAKTPQASSLLAEKTLRCELLRVPLCQLCIVAALLLCKITPSSYSNRSFAALPHHLALAIDIAAVVLRLRTSVATANHRRRPPIISYAHRARAAACLAVQRISPNSLRRSRKFDPATSSSSSHLPGSMLYLAPSTCHHICERCAADECVRTPSCPLRAPSQTHSVVGTAKLCASLSMPSASRLALN